MLIKTPFGDAIGDDSVPTKGSAKGEYDATTIPDVPGRDGGYLPELYFDKNFGDPKLSGPIKTPAKDAIK